MVSQYRFATSLLVSSLLGTVLSVSASGQAIEDDDKAEAQSHFAAATRLYEVEDYKGAAAEFEASVKLYPTKNGYFNLANCYKALHRYHDALVAVAELESRFEDKLDKTMRRKKDELKSLINSVVGMLTIYVEPAEAEITLDGNPVAAALIGQPVEMGPGEHRIEGRMSGYESVVKRVNIESQNEHTVHITLSPSVGSLIVRTNVDGATLWVDGREVGKTPVAPFRLRAGDRLLEIFADGYIKQSRTVQIVPGSRTTLDIQLHQAVAATVSAEDKPSKLIPGLKIAGIATTATTAVLSGVFYGLAAKQASDFKTYDSEYSSAADDEAAAAADIKRQDAKKKTDQFSASGLAFGICAGVFGVSTIVLAVIGKRMENKTQSTNLSVKDGLITVSY